MDPCSKSDDGSVDDVARVVVFNPFNETQSMPDMPTLALQYDFSKTFYTTKKGLIRSVFDGYMHSHMDAFFVPAGFPEVPYLNFEDDSRDESVADQAVMFGRVRTQGHIHGKNPAAYFADVILIVQPDQSCSFYRLDSRGLATGEIMQLQANGALNPSSRLRKCPFPCTFLPGELQPKYTARENWQFLECIAQDVAGANWQVDAMNCFLPQFYFITSPIASEGRCRNHLGTVVRFGMLLCLMRQQTFIVF